MTKSFKVNKFQISEVKNVVVVGAGHGIGLAIVSKLLKSNVSLDITAAYHDPSKAKELLKLEKEFEGRLRAYQLDPTNETQVFELANSLKFGRLELLVNTVGFLEDTEIAPEKSLKDVNVDQLLRYFLVNSIVTSLLAKAFYPFFRHDHPSAYISLSAKVGSIEDNQLGGWYGYRASKAAQNMFIRNIALEYSRRSCNSLVLAVHPGTTKTELSKNFTKKTNLKLHTPGETAANILNVINGLSVKETGSFYSWDSSKIPW